MISSVRSTGTLISTIADSTFSSRMSSRMVPVATSVISDVTGFFFSKATPAFASAQHIFWISRNRTPTPGRPNSMVNPTSPTFTRPLTSLVLTSSVPRPSIARRFMRHARVGKRAAHDPRPGQLVRLERGRGTDVGLGIEAQPHHGQNILRTVRTSVGLRCSWLKPLKQA